MPDDIRYKEWEFRVSKQWTTWQEAVKAALEGSAHSLKATMLVNGGAAVALLAFLGNVAARDSSGSVHLSVGGMRWALMIFLLGVSSSTLAYGLRWGVGYSDAMGHRLMLKFTGLDQPSDRVTRAANRWARSSDIMTLFAMLLALASLASFVWGGIVCYRSIW